MSNQEIQGHPATALPQLTIEAAIDVLITSFAKAQEEYSDFELTGQHRDAKIRIRDHVGQKPIADLKRVREVSKVFSKAVQELG